MFWFFWGGGPSSPGNATVFYTANGGGDADHISKNSWWELGWGKNNTGDFISWQEWGGNHPLWPPMKNDRKERRHTLPLNYRTFSCFHLEDPKCPRRNTSKEKSSNLSTIYLSKLERWRLKKGEGS